MPTARITKRRMLFGTLQTLAAVSLMRAGRLSAQEQDAELPHLEEDDPQAQALKYVHDATQAERPEKLGVAGEDQFCHNCQFFQGETGEWRPCQLFPGKAVNENGWCMSWISKTA